MKIEWITNKDRWPQLLHLDHPFPHSYIKCLVTQDFILKAPRFSMSLYFWVRNALLTNKGHCYNSTLSPLKEILGYYRCHVHLQWINSHGLLPPPPQWNHRWMKVRNCVVFMLVGSMGSFFDNLGSLFQLPNNWIMKEMVAIVTHNII